MLKKAMSTLMLVLSVSFVTPERPAHALLGALIPGAGILVFTGMLAAINGTVITIAGHKPDSWYGGPAMILLGILMLDDHQQAGVKWSPMSTTQAGKLGIGETERLSFNSELPVIRGVSEEAAQAKTVDESKAVWKDYLPTFAPATRGALEAMARYESARAAAR